MSESLIWDQVKSKWQRIKAERVENSCGNGMADIYFEVGRGAGWIESKYVERVTHRIKFQPNQPNWLRNRKIPAFIFVKVGKGHGSYVNVYETDSISELESKPICDVKPIYSSKGITAPFKYLENKIVTALRAHYS